MAVAKRADYRTAPGWLSKRSHFNGLWIRHRAGAVDADLNKI